MFKKMCALIITASLMVLTGCSSSPGIYTPHKAMGNSFIDPGPDGNEPNGGINLDGNKNGTNQTFVGLNQDLGGNPLGKEISHPFETSLVYFSYDSAIVGAAYDDMIKALADYIKANPTYHLSIGGHCDERGSDEYNRSLGERRALSVKEALGAMGVSANRVTTVSFGEDKPAVTGSGNESYAKNRRADFKMYDTSK